jgi:hypothetical protein
MSDVTPELPYSILTYCLSTCNGYSKFLKRIDGGGCSGGTDIQRLDRVLFPLFHVRFIFPESLELPVVYGRHSVMYCVF